MKYLRPSCAALGLSVIFACSSESPPRDRGRDDDTAGASGTAGGSSGSRGTSGGSAGVAGAGGGGSGGSAAGGVGGSGGGSAGASGGAAGGGAGAGGGADAAVVDAAVGDAPKGGGGGNAVDAGAGDAAGAITAGAVLRIDVPCRNKEFVSGSGATCAWDPAKFKNDVAVTKPVAGDATVTYDVVLRARGVVEPRTYLDATGKMAATNTTKPILLVDGKPVEGNDYNVYRVEIAEPKQVFYLNAYKQVGHLTFAIDHMFTAKVKGGAALTLGARDRNAEIIANFNKLVVPAIPPAPDPFNGQFVQVDVVSVSPAK